jgi:cobalt-precorrin-5B (C1)-methyltransferase
MLDEARKRHFKKIILAGHPGKLAKLLRGDFHTHSAVSKPANDIMFDIIKQHMQNRDQGSEVRCQESAAKNSPFDTSSPDSIKKRDESKSALSRNTKVKSPPLSGTMLKGFKEATTVEGMVELLQEYGNLSIMDKIAGMIEAKIYAFYQDGQQYIRPEVGVILFDMKGSVVGISDSAQSWLNHTKTKLLS